MNKSALNGVLLWLFGLVAAIANASQIPAQLNYGLWFRVGITLTLSAFLFAWNIMPFIAPMIEKRSACTFEAQPLQVKVLISLCLYAVGLGITFLLAVAWTKIV